MFSLMLVFIGLATLSTAATVSNVGPCRFVPEQPDPDFNLAEFNKEYMGTWIYFKAVESEANDKLTWLFYSAEPTIDPSTWERTLYYGRKDGATGIFEKDILQDGWPIIAKGTSIDGPYELKIYPMKYEPGRFFYYYICSDQSGVQDLDFRYLTARSELSKEEANEIDRMEKQYGFKGKFIDLPNRSYYQAMS